MATLPVGGVRNEPSLVLPDSPQAEPTEAPSDTVPSTVTQSNWTAYINHLNEYFYNPDTEALEIVLSCLASHYHKDCDPVWLFVIGPSGGDKTSIMINSILDLPNVYMQGIITSKTFLSGYTGTAHASLLHQIGNGVLAFKDFTTFMSESLDEQAKIASQLREIYDGSFVKHTGKGIPITWKGKLTVIAAATPALERAWATRRDLGERFIQVRINRKDGINQSEYAQRQRGREEFISTTMKRLCSIFFQSTPHIINPPPKLSPNQINRVANMAELISHCRGTVPRHPITGVIQGLAQIENSGRMSKALAGLISNHAALFRREYIDESDMAIGKRVALNTIPENRALIINNIPLNGSIPNDQLIQKVGLPPSTIATHVGDLESLGVLRIQHLEVICNNIMLTPLAKKLWEGAFIPVIPTIEVSPLPN